MLDFLRYCFTGAVVRRNLLIALVVGSVLSIANQYDAIQSGSVDGRLGMKIFFNFLIPFVVSSVSAAVNRSRS